MGQASGKDRESNGPEYLAFISYRHVDNAEEDRQWATWLHQQLEVYDIPADLIGTSNLRGETIPERIYPVFRDEVSLPADADLSSAITNALNRSRFLIVLCSPRAAQSRYVNEEILHFKRTGKQDRIMAALILGEPNASIDEAKLEDPEDARTLECFPKALQHHLKADGELDTTQPTEPIAANFRLPDGGKGITSPQAYKQHLLTQGRKKSDAERLANGYEEQLNTAKLKIIAGILGVRLEQLTQRDKIHQLNKARAASRRFMHIAALMSALAVVAMIGGGLAYTQWQRAEAEKVRAETLLDQVRNNLNFMNFSLRDVMKVYVPQDKRVPVMQRIDVIVESLQQHGNQTIGEQRQIAVAIEQKADLILDNSQLDPAEALPLYQEAHVIFEEIVKQDPTNTLYKRDLALSHGKLGDVQTRLGQTDAALAHYETHLKLTQALLKQDPANTRSRRSLALSHFSLGKIQLRRGQTDAALTHYESGLKITQALVKQDPTNSQFQRDLSAAHNKLGDVQIRLEHPDAALVHFQAGLKIRQALLKQDPANTRSQRDLSVSHGKVGRAQLRLGRTEMALSHYESLFKVRQALAKQDPTNSQFQRDLSAAHNMLGDVQLRLEHPDAALTHYESGIKIIQALLTRDPKNAGLQRNLFFSYKALAKTFAARKEYATAYTHMARAHDGLSGMQASGTLPLDDAKYIDSTRKEMERLKGM